MNEYYFGQVCRSTTKEHFKYRHADFSFLVLLADRTNGRTYARLNCVRRRRRLSVTLCIVAKRCVLEQKLLLAVYRKSYMRNRLVP